jgi:hypothetical protein
MGCKISDDWKVEEWDPRGSVVRTFAICDRLDVGIAAYECEIAANFDPSRHSSMSLISGENSNLRWDHRWARNSTRGIAIFRKKINALLDFEGGMTVARDFTINLPDRRLARVRYAPISNQIPHRSELTVCAKSRPSAGINCCQWHHSAINLMIVRSQKNI